MEEYNYKIASARLRLLSDEPLLENPQTELFRAEPSVPDVTVTVHVTDDLPELPGQAVNTSIDTKLCVTPDSCWQETVNRVDGKPLLICRIPREGEPEVWSKRSYLPYTVRSFVLWSAMDLPYLLLRRGVLTIHSSSVAQDGRVILFAAPSRTGKSTQARLWHEYRGAEVLNGDKNCILLRDGRPYAAGTPFSGTSGICNAYELPLAAIVLLRQAPENTVRRLQGIRALMPIMQNCFGHRMVPGCVEQMSDVLSEVLAKVPVFELACTPDERAVAALEAALGEV